MRGYILATVFMIFVAATTALSAWIMKDVVNQVFVDRDMDELIFCAAQSLVISIARGISLYGSTVTLIARRQRDRRRHAEAPLRPSALARHELLRPHAIRAT